MSRNLQDPCTHLPVTPLLVALLSMARVYNDVISAAVVEAAVVTTNFAAFAQHPILVASLAVARPHVDGLVVVVVVGGAVDAHGFGLASDLKQFGGRGK